VPRYPKDFTNGSLLPLFVSNGSKARTILTHGVDLVLTGATVDRIARKGDYTVTRPEIFHAPVQIDLQRITRECNYRPVIFCYVAAQLTANAQTVCVPSSGWET
jgi:hypothetical protein